MSPYSPAGQRVYEEAIRTIPGLIAAKERKAPTDASILFEGYMDKARSEGLTSQQSWSILFNASIHWAHQLVRGIAAKDGDRTAEQVASQMGQLAAAWMG